MNEKIYLRAITVSWVLLIIVFISKILFGATFNFATNNELFVTISNFIEKDTYINLTARLLSYCITGIIYISIACDCKKFTIIDYLISLVGLSIGFFARFYLPETLSWCSMFIDLFPMIIIPIILNKVVIRPIIACVINLSFQLLSCLIRDMACPFVNIDTFSSLLFQVDYITMLVLYFLYTKKKNLYKGENNG